MSDSYQEITNRIAPGVWLKRFELEYLDDFIPSGGSVVRFLSGAPSALDLVRNQLEETSRKRALWFRHLNPALLDERGRPAQFHRIDEFYKAVVEGYDWSGHARSMLFSHLRSSGIEVSHEANLSDIEAIAQANQRDVPDLVREVKRLGTEMIRDRSMTHEFRLGVAALAKDAMLPDPGAPSLEHVLIAWLRGHAVPGGAKILKRIGIFDRIRAVNARDSLASFASWLRKGDSAGSLIVLDLRPYEHKRMSARELANQRDKDLRAAIESEQPRDQLDKILNSPGDPGPFFSDRAFLQMLDLLRHFIDDVEAFPALALVVLSTDGFYDERSGRSFFQYNALQTRIAQEVRDSAHPNPVAVLSHLGSAA